MQPNSYQDFVKLGKDKQVEMIQKAQQGNSGPIPDFGPFPEEDFIELMGTQDKKPIKLATYRCAAQNAQAVVIFFHTMGLHARLAVNYAKVFANMGITFVAYEQRGHGRSEGERGYLDNADEVLKDARNFISAIAKIYPEKPLFLMGHGAGGLVSLICQKQFKDVKFSGLILSSPALKKPSNKLVSAISGVAFKLMPNKTGLFEPKYQMVTKNPNASAFLQKDELSYHGKVYAGTLSQMLSLMDRNPQKNWKQLQTCPIVFVQPQLDKPADPMNAIQLFESIKTKDKTFLWFPKMWNNLFLEEECKEIPIKLGEWIKQRAK